ncbi:MAG TPA: ABC transporter substrate-binding protein [Acidimicrobiales bacterium]|nr:ABC transporter substrate-binding protein [Acidimicrobiales bacterium]
MQRLRRAPGLLVVLACVSVIAAACGSSGSSSSSTSTTSGAVKHGGTLIVGAEQEPDCMDWIGSCAGSSWGTWMGNVTTMAKVYVTDPDNNYVLSPAMSSATLSAGPPQKVTYTISPKAKWSDGQPITSADFQYTWDQIAHGKDIYSTQGYSDISSVDTPSPNVAVATFIKPYAPWKDLFGADGFGILPSHILKGQDRDAAMKNGYTWSGGPWMMPANGWVKGQSITLVPNPNYYAQKPYLDKVVFQIITDTSSEAKAYQTGQFMMIYPQPQVTLAQTVKNLPNSNFKVYESLNFEGVWFNLQKPPLNDINVRQALGYATDRDLIVSQLFGPIDPSLKALEDGMSPGLTKYYQSNFSKYKLDLTKVDSLMKASGWAKNAAGYWAKNGQEADLTVKSTAGNARRELMEQILQSQWKTAGFNLTVANEQSGTLFGQDLPGGNFQIGIYAQTPTSPDPSNSGCIIFCTVNIPGPANQNSGENWDRVSDPSLDNSFGPADTELNDATRTSEVQKGQQALANLVPFLPLDPLPSVLVWSSKVQGPVGNNPTMGPFWNMNYWHF